MKEIPVRTKKKGKESTFQDVFGIKNHQKLANDKPLMHLLHRHDFYFILMLSKGSGQHQIDFVSYPVKNYSVFFIKPGQIHELKLDAGYEGYIINFEPEAFSNIDRQKIQLLNRVSNHNHYQFNDQQFPQLNHLAEEILSEYHAKNTGYDTVIKSYMNILFTTLLRNIDQTRPAAISPYNQERFEELQALIENHFTEHKTTSFYAEKMNLSDYQLNTITKQTVNKTCSKIAGERVILEAKRYLLSTSNQVNQIAFYLGYEDVSYFIRQFKKQTGHTPEAFRKNYK